MLKKLFIVIVALMISACKEKANTNLEQSAKERLEYSKNAVAKMKAKFHTDIEVNWYVDEHIDDTDLTFYFHDMSWHLITMEVSAVNHYTTPIRVESIVATIYPKPLVDVGQRVEVEDINCSIAIFSKVGDKCSFYIKINYDTSKVAERVDFPVQVYTKGELPALLAFNASIKPNQSAFSIRPIASIENKYYVGEEILKEKNSYKIVALQNGFLFPILITRLSQPQNKHFSLMNRKDNSDKDPYYGDFAQCSVYNNANLKQINELVALDDFCLLIFKVDTVSGKSFERDIIYIDSNAYNTFPDVGHFALYASYGGGIQPRLIQGKEFTVLQGSTHLESNAVVMDTAGILESGYISDSNDFVKADFDYKVAPNRIEQGDYIIRYSDYTKGYELYAKEDVELDNHNPSYLITDTMSIPQLALYEWWYDTNKYPRSVYMDSQMVSGYLMHTKVDVLLAMHEDMSDPNSNPNSLRLYTSVWGEGFLAGGDHEENMPDSTNYLDISKPTEYDIKLGKGCTNSSNLRFISGASLLKGSGCENKQCKYTFRVYGAIGNNCNNFIKEVSKEFSVFIDKPEFYKHIYSIQLGQPDNPKVLAYANQKNVIDFGGLKNIALPLRYDYIPRNDEKKDDGLHFNLHSEYCLSKTKSLSHRIGLDKGDTLESATLSLTRDVNYLESFNILFWY